jgi:hypothetical protein
MKPQAFFIQSNEAINVDKERWGKTETLSERESVDNREN